MCTYVYREETEKQRKSERRDEGERKRERRRGLVERVTGSLFPIPIQSKINLSSYS